MRKGLRQSFCFVLGSAENGVAADILAARTGLSKSALKRAMDCGAVWLQRSGRGKLGRLRRATAPLNAGDRVEVYYDAEILRQRPDPGVCVLEEYDHYGVWYKPAGVLSQGTKYGDHLSLLRRVEKERRRAFLVHRLDREVSGLMLVGYSKRAAAELSRLLHDRLIEKSYLTVVHGRPPQDCGQISQPLDGKEALTLYEMLSTEDQLTRLKVRPVTGRLHQIRRHLQILGCPVVGDTRYGRAGDNGMLQLAAVAIVFRDPFSGALRRFSHLAPF